MFTLKSYTVRPNSDLVDCVVEFVVPIAGQDRLYQRTMQVSQRDSLDENPSWSDEEIKAALALVIKDEVALPPVPAAELAEQAARAAGVAELTEPAR